jgi:hypothetical protein
MEEVVVDASSSEAVASGVHQALQLLLHQYVKLEDTVTGKVRVERGEQLVFPSATEKLMLGITSAVNIDHNTAALVLSRETGQTRLVTERGRYFPGPHEEVVEERQLIKVCQLITHPPHNNHADRKLQHFGVLASNLLLPSLVCAADVAAAG